MSDRGCLLQDERLRLREFGPGDAGEVQALHADVRVRAWLPDLLPLQDPGWAAAFVAGLARFYREHEGLGIWRCGLPLADGGERFAGWFSLMPLQVGPDAQALGMRPGDVELGSRLLPEHWGGGLSLAGGEQLLHHAFERLQARAVWGVCHPGNRPAQACLAALGFLPRGQALYEGQPADHHLLLAADWAELQPLSHRQRLRLRRRDEHAATSSPQDLP